MAETQSKIGQYFTTNLDLKEHLYGFILNHPSLILEPSIGRGDLVMHIKNKVRDVKFEMYEIDKTIKFLEGIDVDEVIFGDFLKQNIKKKYSTIVGNPPFVRTKKGNLYIDFIKKCYNLLEDGGELVFIVPSDFFKLTSASALLNEMMEKGVFTHVYHPNDEKMFEGASIDVMIFRYCKDESLEKRAMYNGRDMRIINSYGLITFSDRDDAEGILIEDLFDVYVGMVSGRDEIYKNDELGNIEVLNGEGRKDRYIFIEEYPSEDEEINDYLLEYKDDLLKRKIKKFSERNWFEWGAPRNMSTVNEKMGTECIYIYNLTRQSRVAFKGEVQYFGGGLIMLIPKVRCCVERVISFLNSDEFKNNFMFSGRFKIGHRQICNSFIPKSCL